MFNIKQHDTSRPFTATLKDSAGAVVDLTGASAVRFLMSLLGATAPAVSASATVVSATAGTVKYAWAVGDTAVVGLYVVEVQVVQSDGTTRTLPENDYFYVNVMADLG